MNEVPVPIPISVPPEPLLTCIKVVDYDKTSGEILRTITFPDPIEATTLYPNCLYLPVETDTNDVRRYVSGAQVVDRPVQPVTVEGLVLKGVRAGAKIVIEGVTYECDGTDVELEFSHPGTYDITVTDWPYLDWRTTVEN